MTCVLILWILVYAVPSQPHVITITNISGELPATLSEVKTIEQALHTIIAVVKNDMGLGSINPLNVYLYDNISSLRRFGPTLEGDIPASEIGAGARLNEIHVNLSAFNVTRTDGSLAAQFFEVLAHEYAHNLHYALASDSTARVPEWFAEGFAGWMAAGVLHKLGWQPYEISLHRAERELLYHKDRLMTLSALDARKGWNAAVRQSHSVIKTYVFATVVVDRLISREGREAALQYFKTGIFASSFRLSWENFANDFDGYLRGLAAEYTEPFRVNKPQWNVGDVWVYSRARMGRKERIKREVIKEAEHEGIPCYLLQEGNRTILYAKGNLAQLADLEDGKLSVRRSKPYVLSDWPLEPGKTWENIYTFDDFKRRVSGKARPNDPPTPASSSASGRCSAQLYAALTAPRPACAS